MFIQARRAVLSRATRLTIESLEARKLLTGLIHETVQALGGTTPDSWETRSDASNGRYAVVAEVNGDIRLEVYNASGSTVVSAMTVNAETAGTQTTPDVALWPDGSSVVVWVDQNGRDGSDYGIYARRISASGTPVGDDILVNTTTSARQDRPHVATGANGTFYVTWENDSGRGSRDYLPMYRRFVDGVGGSEITLRNSRIWEPTIAVNDDSVAMVVYEDANGGGVRAITIIDEVVASSELAVNGGWMPDLAVDPDGDFVCASSDSYSIVLNGIHPDLTLKGGTIMVLERQNNIENMLLFRTPSLAIDAGGAIAVTATSDLFDLNAFDSVVRSEFAIVEADGTPLVARTDIGEGYVWGPIGVAAADRGTFTLATRGTRTAHRLYTEITGVDGPGADSVTLNESGNTLSVDSNGISQFLSYAGHHITIDLGNGANQLSAATCSIPLEVLSGTDASEIVTGSGDDTIVTGDGNDTINAGAGDDSLTINAGVDSVQLGDGADYLLGTGGNKVVYGGAGNDSIYTGSGDDTLTGGDGQDGIVAGDGANSIDGGADADYLSGGTGNDTFDAGDGDDYIFALAGNNQIDAGAGNDSVSAAEGNDIVTLGDGNDTLVAGHGANNIDGGAGADEISAESGNDTVVAGEGADTISVGDGANNVDSGAGPDAISTGSGNDTIVAGDGNDIVTAGDGVNSIDGGAGADNITTGTGSDTIAAGDGNDTILAGDGANSIHAGADDDSVVGGGGQDTINLGDGNDFASGGGDRDLLNGGAGNDTLNGGGSADTVYGDDGDDRLGGNGGNDRLFGAVGIDRVYGGDGNDTLDGGTQSDRLYGGIGDDQLAGGSGKDRVYGEAGNDTLSGGSQADVLVGGIGADRFFARDGEIDTLFSVLGIDLLTRDTLDVVVEDA